MITLTNTIFGKIERREVGECWIWPGAKTRGGYGRIGREGRTLAVHRVLVEEAQGRPIPPGQVVMHSCDVPACCNPAHLRVGTKADNSADMVAKSRSRVGARHPLARLSQAAVDDIRTRVKSGEGRREIAEQYGVSYQHLCQIVNGKKWPSRDRFIEQERLA